MSAITIGGSARTSARSARRRSDPPDRRIRIENPCADRSTADATRSSAASATPSASPPTSSATATRCCARSSRYKAPGDRSWLEAPLTRIDAHVNGDRWAGEFTVDDDRPLAVDDRGLERPVRRPGATSSQRKLAAGQTDLVGELRGRRAARGAPHAASRRGVDRARHRARARGRRRAGARRSTTRARPGALRGGRAQRRAPWRDARCRSRPRPSRSTACARGSRSWYELFPRSWGGFEGVEAQIPRDRRARLRRPLPAAHPPDRPQEPQGPQQHARRRSRTTPARRRRSAPPRAATTRSTPSWAR